MKEFSELKYGNRSFCLEIYRDESMDESQNWNVEAGAFVFRYIEMSRWENFLN